jgi:hypothetical protein
MQWAMPLDYSSQGGRATGSKGLRTPWVRRERASPPRSGNSVAAVTFIRDRCAEFPFKACLKRPVGAFLPTEHPVIRAQVVQCLNHFAPRCQFPALTGKRIAHGQPRLFASVKIRTAGWDGWEGGGAADCESLQLKAGGRDVV